MSEIMEQADEVLERAMVVTEMVAADDLLQRALSDVADWAEKHRTNSVQWAVTDDDDNPVWAIHVHRIE